jgi:hypothetical protein
MDTPDLTAPTGALTASQATRASVRGVPADDPERVVALREALGSLMEAWTDDYRAYMRSGSRMVRRTPSDDPRRALAREREAEIRLLRKALAPTSGSAYKRRTERRSAAQMDGTLTRYAELLRVLVREHDTVQNLYGGGSWSSNRHGGTFRNMRELNAAATEIKGKLHAQRIDLNAAWESYQRHLASERATMADHRREDHLAERLDLWRADAAELYAALRRSERRRTPLERPREPWTAESARKALRGFKAAHGREARKADCRPEFNLPHYTQLRRLLGPNPLSGG